MAESAPGLLTITPLCSVWACGRDGCTTPLEIVNWGVTYQIGDPAQYAQAAGILADSIFIHGATDDAPARYFSFDDLTAGVQEDWIMACHEEQQGGKPVEGPRRKDIPAPVIRDLTTPPPSPHPAPAPDPRRQGPAPDRRVRPQ